MARLPRLAAAGHPHHIIQRGNNRQLIFRDPADCETYLRWLREAAAGHELAIHAYVLMPNHVHLLATPVANDTLSTVMQSLGRRYVRWFNKRYQRTGTLWEGRFRSSVIDGDRYLLTCMRYIESNPVRAGLAAEPVDFRWSSFRHHVGLTLDPIITDHSLLWELGNTPFDRQLAYRRLFETPIAADQLDTLRSRTNRGWAVGSAEFAALLAPAAARPTQPQQRGRPRKPPPQN